MFAEEFTQSHQLAVAGDWMHFFLLLYTLHESNCVSSSGKLFCVLVLSTQNHSSMSSRRGGLDQERLEAKDLLHMPGSNAIKQRCLGSENGYD